MAKEKSNALVWIFFITLLVRLTVFAFSTPTWINVDEFFYLTQGKMLANGYRLYLDFPSPYPPGAALLFTLQHFLLDDAWIYTRLLTILLDCLNACLIYRLAGLVTKNGSQSLASLLYIFNPLSLFSNAASISETYTLLLVLTGYYMLLKKKPSFLIAGWALAYTLFVKYYIVFFVLPPILYLCWKNKDLRKILVYIPVIYLLMIITTVSDYPSFIYHTLQYYEIHSTMPFPVKLSWFFIFFIIMQPHTIVYAKNFFKNISFIHIWWISSGFLVYFPVIFEHHLLLVLPASCLIASQTPPKISMSELTGLVRKPFGFAVIFTLIVVFIFIEALLLPVLYHLNPQHLYSHVIPITSSIIEETDEDTFVLADYPEFAYLSDRRPLLNYIWAYETYYESNQLIQELTGNEVIVASEEFHFPAGFKEYLMENYVEKKYPGGFTVYKKE